MGISAVGARFCLGAKPSWLVFLPVVFDGVEGLSRVASNDLLRKPNMAAVVLDVNQQFSQIRVLIRDFEDQVTAVLFG